jgi:hypothetical protein
MTHHALLRVGAAWGDVGAFMGFCLGNRYALYHHPAFSLDSTGYYNLLPSKKTCYNEMTLLDM